MALERGSPLFLEINNLIRCSPHCKGASFPGCAMETRSFVWLPTGNEWIQQIEGGPWAGGGDKEGGGRKERKKRRREKKRKEGEEEEGRR